MFAPRSALFLPASNPRAIAKARGLDCDMVILDLEDAVVETDKETARTAAANAGTFGDRPVAIRVNPSGTRWHDDDLAAVASSSIDLVVVPKVAGAEEIASAATRCGKPVAAMIETPAGVLAVPGIARVCVGLIAGTNDLAAELRLPGDPLRTGLQLALQAIVLAARAAGIWALDGVFNGLADPGQLAAECAQGRLLGFDGKTLIHPNQIVAANAAFSPTAAELDDARELVAADASGAARFRDRMIEPLHVAAARRMLARS